VRRQVNANVPATWPIPWRTAWLTAVALVPNGYLLPADRLSVLAPRKGKVERLGER